MWVFEVIQNAATRWWHPLRQDKQEYVIHQMRNLLRERNRIINCQTREIEDKDALIDALMRELKSVRCIHCYHELGVV
jgi:hypothetical protein